MLGYWNSDLSNSQSLFKDKNNDCWYKTGDLVEVNEDNNYLFKGRIDRMVKRNGYRIELSEIEHILHQHDQIIENAVIASIDAENVTTITAFVICRAPEWESTIKMKEYCTKYLSLYMIPNNFIFLKSLPQTVGNQFYCC